MKGIATVSGVASAGVFTYKSITESGYLVKAVSTPIKEFKSTINILATSFKKFIKTGRFDFPKLAPAGQIAGAVMETIAAIYLVVQIADLIWDLIKEHWALKIRK
jgi:hypothetical protein